MSVFDKIEQMGNDNRIIAGDFNCTLNDQQDKKGGKITHVHTKVQQLINIYMDETNLIDIWRKQNPSETIYTCDILGLSYITGSDGLSYITGRKGLS